MRKFIHYSRNHLGINRVRCLLTSGRCTSDLVDQTRFEWKFCGVTGGPVDQK
jgi:hypothetical protein